MRRAAAILALTAATAAAAAAAAPAHAKTVWLCKPGLHQNPCAGGSETARYSPDGRLLGGESRGSSAKPKIDCFYVYPTVSDQQTPAATRTAEPAVRSIARFQAAGYASACRIFAPVYRQVTLAGLTTAAPADRERAYRDVRAAWRDYLEHRNRGRGVVLIGHSQGTFILRRLVAEEIDGTRSVRRRLVSALLLGGNVTVARGKDRGGDFEHIRACRAPTQVGCVVAFSTYNAPVPADAPFGRTLDPAEEVLCTNPAALGGGSAPIDAIVPGRPFAPGTGIAAVIAALGFPFPANPATWLSFPGAYTARCADEDDAHVLQVTPTPGAPALAAVPASWGLHVVDANLALGDLEALVRRQAKAYLRR